MDQGWEFTLGKIQCVRGSMCLWTNVSWKNFITVRGFTMALVSLDNIHIAHFLFNYDAENG